MVIIPVVSPEVRPVNSMSVCKIYVNILDTVTSLKISLVNSSIKSMANVN